MQPKKELKDIVDNGTYYATYDGEIKKSSYPSLAKTVNTDTPEGMAVEAALAAIQGGPQPKLDSLTIEKNITLN